MYEADNPWTLKLRIENAMFDANLALLGGDGDEIDNCSAKNMSYVLCVGTRESFEE